MGPVPCLQRSTFGRSAAALVRRGAVHTLFTRAVGAMASAGAPEHRALSSPSANALGGGSDSLSSAAAQDSAQTSASLAALNSGVAGLSVTSPALPEKKVTADAEQFFAMDLRAGTILTAKLNPKARQPAYVLEIDLGPLGTVKSSAQLTANYTAEALQGRRVVVVANLPPRKIAGVKSEVLVLGTMSAEQGTLLLSPDERAANGTPVG